MSVLLFAGLHYYPGYGWHDFVGQYPSVQAAKQAVNATVHRSERGDVWAGTDDNPWQWAQIVEHNTIVSEFDVLFIERPGSFVDPPPDGWDDDPNR